MTFIFKGKVYFVREKYKRRIFLTKRGILSRRITKKGYYSRKKWTWRVTFRPTRTTKLIIPSTKLSTSLIKTDTTAKVYDSYYFDIFLLSDLEKIKK